MSPATSSENLQAEFDGLIGLVQDLTSLLRTQRDILRQRGISLPPGALSGLKIIAEELETIKGGIEASGAEVERLRAVIDTTALINNATLPLDEVLNTVMDTVIELTSAERGYIVLRDEETGALVFRVARGMDQQALGETENIVSRTIVQRVAETGEPVVTTNAQEDDRFSSQESIVGFALRSILCVPLKVRGKIIGVAYADNRIREALFGPRERDLLAAFANQAAVAIQNARLFNSVRRSLDEITELKELLDDVFESIVSGVITTDVANAITTFNRAARHILAISEYVEEERLLLTEVLPMDGGFAGLLASVRTEGKSEICEVAPEIPARGKVNLNLRLSPLRDAENITQGVAIVMDDLTELRKQEAQLAAVRRYLPPQMVDNIQSIHALALGGEEREVTALFINVVPFEMLLNEADTAQFMTLLNRYLTVATDAMHEQEGIIDKYMGTDVMGLFNTQLNPAKEDHAWRAVRAALNAARGLTTLQQELSAELGQDFSRLYCRVGINSGVATVGNVGSLERREFTAIGDAINLAKRLEENTQPGQILISEHTCALCRTTLAAHTDTIEVIDRGAIRVKGRQQLTEIYEVRYR